MSVVQYSKGIFFDDIVYTVSNYKALIAFTPVSLVTRSVLALLAGHHCPA